MVQINVIAYDVLIISNNLKTSLEEALQELDNNFIINLQFVNNSWPYKKKLPGNILLVKGIYLFFPLYVRTSLCSHGRTEFPKNGVG
jgi:hypothetical protein